MAFAVYLSGDYSFLSGMLHALKLGLGVGLVSWIYFAFFYGTGTSFLGFVLFSGFMGMMLYGGVIAFYNRATDQLFGEEKLVAEYGITSQEYKDLQEVFVDLRDLRDALDYAKEEKLSIIELMSAEKELIDVGGYVKHDDARKLGLTNSEYVELIKQQDACGEDWQKCRDNEQLVNHYDNYDDVRSACKTSAEKMNVFGDIDWPLVPFGVYYTGKSYIETGIVLLSETEAKVPNAFGTPVKRPMECTYDLKAKKVLSLN